MKKKTFKRRSDKAIVPLLCAGFLSGGNFFRLHAADDWTLTPPARPEGETSSASPGTAPRFLVQPPARAYSLWADDHWTAPLPSDKDASTAEPPSAPMESAPGQPVEPAPAPAMNPGLRSDDDDSTGAGTDLVMDSAAEDAVEPAPTPAATAMLRSDDAAFSAASDAAAEDATEPAPSLAANPILRSDDDASSIAGAGSQRDSTPDLTEPAPTPAPEPMPPSDADASAAADADLAKNSAGGNPAQPAPVPAAAPPAPPSGPNASPAAGADVTDHSPDGNLVQPEPVPAAAPPVPSSDADAFLAAETGGARDSAPGNPVEPAPDPAPAQLLASASDASMIAEADVARDSANVYAVEPAPTPAPGSALSPEADPSMIAETDAAKDAATADPASPVPALTTNPALRPDGGDPAASAAAGAEMKDPADVDPENPVPTAAATPAAPANADPAASDDQAPAPTPAPAAAAPSPSPAETGPQPESQAQPQPQQPVGPLLLPPYPTAQEVAAGVPLPENPYPAMEQPYSEWDLAQVETPMFMTEAINDFAERPLYLTGNWSFKPHLSIGTFYDGNIFVRSHDTTSDFITDISPGVTMRLGNTESIFYLVADYTASLNWYMEHPKETNVDQNASGSFQWSLPRTTIGLHLGVSSSTGTDIDATNEVRQQLYFAGLTTHYAYGDKTSFDLNGDYTRTDFDGLISSSQFDAAAFFNYDYSPKTQLGIGGAAGYVIVPGQNNDQEYEEANLRATYRATGKITLIGEVGTEFRQYAAGGGDTITPVFSLTAGWNVREGTTITLGLQRQMYVSAILTDQDYTATSVSTTVSQRITDQVSTSLTLSYINSDYSATANGVNASREDNYFEITPAIQWKATSWLSVGIFYDYSQNLSHGQEADSFQRDRGGVDFAILF